MSFHTPLLYCAVAVLNANNTFCICVESLTYNLYFVAHLGGCSKLSVRDTHRSLSLASGDPWPVLAKFLVPPASGPTCRPARHLSFRPPPQRMADGSLLRIFAPPSWDFLSTWIRVHGLPLSRPPAGCPAAVPWGCQFRKGGRHGGAAMPVPSRHRPPNPDLSLARVQALSGSTMWQWSQGTGGKGEPDAWCTKGWGSW